MEGTGRQGEWARNSEKDKGGGKGGWVFSVRCLPGLNESTCFVFFFPFFGVGGDMAWGMDNLKKNRAHKQRLFQGSLCSTIYIAFNSLPIPNIKLPKMCVCLTLSVHSITNWLPTAVWKCHVWSQALQKKKNCNNNKKAATKPIISIKHYKMFTTSQAGNASMQQVKWHTPNSASATLA